MKCDDVDELLIDYLEGSLEKDLCNKVDEHIQVCERCLDVVNESQRLLTIISGVKMEEPDETLRINFYHMLHSEIRKGEKASDNGVKRRLRWFDRSITSFAAGLALLVAGAFIGILLTNTIRNNGSSAELTQLKGEVALLKRTAMFTMLKEESSSNRLQAIDYATDLGKPDANIIAVLFQTLNKDKNVNVRMAAAYALAKFADQKAVSDSLVSSLSLQVDPILQVTLINILVERKEKSALAPMRQIVNNAATLKEVRMVAENGIKVLM